MTAHLLAQLLLALGVAGVQLGQTERNGLQRPLLLDAGVLGLQLHALAQVLHGEVGLAQARGLRVAEALHVATQGLVGVLATLRALLA